MTPGHLRMLTLLEDFTRRSRSEHPILGDKAVQTLRRQLGVKSQNQSGIQAQLSMLAHQWKLGDAELQQGNLKVAIQHLNSARDGVFTLVEAGKAKPAALNDINYRLAVAHMRLGETENCCRMNSPESCILPIQSSGVHTLQEGSRQAIRFFTEVLQTGQAQSATFMKARWLLNLMYMTVGAYPQEVPGPYLLPPRLFQSEAPIRRFSNIAAQLGLDSFDLLGSAVVDDFTGDDYLDLVVCTWDPQDQMQFFVNERNGRFVDWTADANLGGLVGGFNMVQADYDNDGDTDILVLRGGWMREFGRIPNSLLQNDGNGRFTDVTFDAGLGQVHYPTQTGAWADYDNDGDLDLYIGNEKIDASRNAPSQLFRNNGDGTFTDVAEAAGVENFGYAKAVAFGDFDDDGFADIYVSNFGGPNRLYRNHRDGTFTDVAQRVGVQAPKRSFPTWFWDFDNDGDLDLFVAGYAWDDGTLAAYVASQIGMEVGHELSRLYRNDGRSGFTEVAKQVNLKRLTLPMAANYGDLDNDGYLDFYLGTGYPDYEALMPNVMYRNIGGRAFADVTTEGGFGNLQKGHGIVFADLDNDGDQDIYEQMGGFLPGDKFFNALYENPGSGNHWIGLQLVGTRSNRSAIGARIRVDIVDRGKRRTVYKRVNSGASFGANPLRQTIGLGKAAEIELLEIYWPTSGLTQTFRGILANQYIKITEESAQYTLLPLQKLSFE